MTNPSVNFLTSNLLREPLENEIKNFLMITPNIFYTSYEISNAINKSKAYKDLVRETNKYTEPSFREPATHIGSLCATLNIQGVLKRADKFCPTLKTSKAAFAV